MSISSASPVAPSGISGVGFTRSPEIVVDPDTGEAFKTALVPVARKISSRYLNGRQYMAQQQAHMNLALDSDMPKLDYRVYLYLTGVLDFDNLIELNVTHMAQELRVTRPKVSTALNHLIKRGVIHRGPKVGMSFTYRLDPDYGFKGNTGNVASLEKRIRDAGLHVIEGSAPPNTGTPLAGVE